MKPPPRAVLHRSWFWLPRASSFAFWLSWDCTVVVGVGVVVVVVVVVAVVDFLECCNSTSPLRLFLLDWICSRDNKLLVAVAQ